MGFTWHTTTRRGQPTGRIPRPFSHVTAWVRAGWLRRGRRHGV